jgi:uncharacterized protein (DUF488 family)
MIYRILTIGCGNLSIQDFIKNLKKNEVQVVLDIRTTPFSRFRPHFNKERFKQSLQESGIGYQFMGKSLGGIPKSPEFLTDGEVDNNKIRKSINYQKGLNYIEKGLEFDCKMVLVCDCSEYKNCPRHNLLGIDLEKLGYEVIHILRDGSITQEKRLF